MLLRLQNGVRSMQQMMRQQERVANNLANANTVGYKRDRTFTQALNERLDTENAPQSDRVTTQWADWTQGPLEETGNPLDVALDGEGFFVFSDEPTGAQRYSRAGRLTLDADGIIRDPMGFALEGEGGPIQVPRSGGSIEIDRDGAVTVDGKSVGTIRVVTFNDASALRRTDGAAFAAGEAEPVDAESTGVVQGFVETSNVDTVREMTDMIDHFRQFESQQKMLQSTDQLLGAVTRDLGKF